jgi:hypothetical protein
MKNKTILETMTKNDIATYFYKLNKEKYLVSNIVNKFKTSAQFSLIFNRECVESEFNYTMALVLQKIEEYSKPVKNPYSKAKNKELFNSYIMGFKTDLSNPYDVDIHEEKAEAFEVGREHREISNKKIRLDSMDGITGYFIGAFSKNVKKMYQKHKRLKRTASEIIFLDDIFAKQSEETATKFALKKRVINCLKDESNVENKNYKRMLVDIALHLRKVDHKNNKNREEKTSKLAQMFCSIVNEKKCMNNDELRAKFKWSAFMLNKNKDIMMNEIRKNFSNYQKDIVDYLDNREQMIR